MYAANRGYGVDDAELRALLAAQARLISELSERLAPAPKSCTVSVLYKSYAAVDRPEATWRAYSARLRPFVEALGDRMVAELSLADWTSYRAMRSSQVIGPEKHRRTRSASTMNLELGVVRAMLAWGIDQGLISADPFARAKRTKARRHRETAPRPDDIETLLRDAGPLQRVVILCAVDAGMRCSEIRSLSWDWIDRQAMSIALPNWACKGQRGGVVPMTTRLRDAIDAVPRSLRSRYVLSSPRGKDGRYNRRTLSRWWRDAADAAGLEAAPGDRSVHLHDGRHAAASNAVAAGVPIEVVSRALLRHASIAQTLSYVQTPPPDLEAMRKAIEAGARRRR